MEIRIEKTACPKEKPDPSVLGFGSYFTDHMFLMEYSREQGWHDARIVPFGRLSLHPASTVLHYGEEIFEGLKAYRREDGVVQLFRPEENIRRMNRSAERLCLPAVPEEDAVHNAVFCIIASPSGSYYKEGINPVGILIEDEDVRAVRGGTGEAKCGGNYAASNRAGEKAEKSGYSQVLWLDGVERRYVEEVGSMNVMFKIAGEVVTPALTGGILSGITRKSCLQVLRDQGYTVQERRLSVEELAGAMENGTLEEAWGCGTAAVISPIGELCYKGKVYKVNGGEIGPVTHYLYDTLTGIQWGRLPDSYGWTHPLPPKA